MGKLAEITASVCRWAVLFLLILSRAGVSSQTRCRERSEPQGQGRTHQTGTVLGRREGSTQVRMRQKDKNKVKSGNDLPGRVTGLAVPPVLSFMPSLFLSSGRKRLGDLRPPGGLWIVAQGRKHRCR
jgi:hypothetical protein